MKKYLLWLVLVFSLVLVSGCKEQADQHTGKSAQPESKTTQTTARTDNNQSNKNTNVQSGENSSKAISWYFVPNKAHTAPDINHDAIAMMAQNQAIYLLENDSKKIYLTFDCGYELGYTPAILDILQRKQVKAAFFITGQYIQSEADLVKRMHTEGHLVCNHTWNHPDLSKVDQAQLTQELTRLAQRYQEMTGAAMDKYCRPPMGNYSSNSLQWTHELGYTTVFWSMAWQDWDPKNQPGADFVNQYVLDHIHPGAIILMHAVSSSDTEALEKVITDLQAQGYVFSTFE